MSQRFCVLLALCVSANLGCSGSRGGVAADDASTTTGERTGVLSDGGGGRPVAPLPMMPEEDGGACVVGVPAAPEVERGAGASLVLRVALPRYFVTTDVVASDGGATAVVGVLPSGSFGDPNTKEPFHAYVAASFDERGALRFARVVGSAFGTSERRPRIALDKRGLVVAATVAGEVGARERIVIHGFDATGSLRYERTLAGPRQVVVDALERSAGGGVLVAGHFDETVDGITVPAFEPARFRNAFVAELDTDGAVRKVVVLPVGQIAALATAPGRVFVAARTDGAATIAGTRLPMSDGRLEASSLVTALDATTLAPTWMVPLRPSLSRASLVATRGGQVWLGGLEDPALLRFDPRGTTKTENAAPSAVLVEREEVDEPSWLASTSTTSESGLEGSVLGVHRPSGATRSFPMNVRVLDVAAAGSTQVALVVSPLWPKMHPHCSLPAEGSSSIVVLRRE
jgi:hypothetical protein